MSDQKEEKKKESKNLCKDCAQYSRKTKMCNDIKYVPRKGTCQSFIGK